MNDLTLPFTEEEDAKTDALLKEGLINVTLNSSEYKRYVEQEQTREDFGKLRNKIIMKISDKFYVSEIRLEIAQYIVSHQHIITLRDAKCPEMWIYNEGYYKPHAETYIQEFLLAVAQKYFTTSLLNDILTKVRAMTYREPEDMFEDHHREYVCIENGVFHLRTKKLIEHSPDFIFFNKLPVTYSPESQCPAINEFVKSTVSPHDIPVIQELFGFTLYRRYFIKKAAIFSGGGSNGKSKLLELLTRMIGKENICQKSLLQLETQNFAKAELFGKLANVVGELSSETLKNTDMFKTVTGGDPVTADRKNRSQITFIPYAKQMFCANQLPITMDVSDGFFDRWILIEFPNRFISQDEYDALKVRPPNVFPAKADIIEKIATKAEIDGLFNWSVDGLQRLFERGAFSYSLTSDDVKIKWLRTSNSLAAFILDNCIEDNEKHIHKSSFKKSYIDYCRNHKLKFVSDDFIKKYLTTNHSVQEARKGAESVPSWEGIRLKNDEDVMLSECDKLREFSKLWLSEGRIRCNAKYYVISDDLLDSVFNSNTKQAFFDKGILEHVDGKAGFVIGQ